MARTAQSHIRNALTRVLSPQSIRARASALGVVKRRRKIDIVALVYTLVLGSDRGAVRTLASLRRSYELTTGTTLAPSAFYDRMTTELAQLMQQLSDRAFAQLARRGTRLHRALAAFVDVFIADGSLVRLGDGIHAQYTSVFTNHMKASAKVHVVMNGATRTPKIVRIVPGSTHDVTLAAVGPFCRGALFVFDLAYYQGKLFRRIIDEGGHFLCRVKKDANFRITDAARREWLGRGHRDVLKTMTGKTFELGIDYAYRHTSERDWRVRHIPLRLVCVWNPTANLHRVYLTTATQEQLQTKHVAAVYALRWEIELLFRELKMQLRLEHMPSESKAASEILIYASLLGLALGRSLLEITRRCLGDLRHRVLPAERGTALLRTAMPMLLELVLGPLDLRQRLEQRLATLFAHEAPDPNRKRLLLTRRAERGLLRMTA